MILSARKNTQTQPWWNYLSVFSSYIRVIMAMCMRQSIKVILLSVCSIIHRDKTFPSGYILWLWSEFDFKRLQPVYVIAYENIWNYLPVCIHLEKKITNVYDFRSLRLFHVAKDCEAAMKISSRCLTVSD